MNKGIVGLRGYQNGGGILDPDDDIPEWMRRLQEQLRRRGTPDTKIHMITEGMQEQMEDIMGRPDWDPLNEEDLAEFILGNPDEWDLHELTPEEARPPYNILDHWNIQADLQEQLGDLESYDIDRIRRAYDRADPEGQDLLRQLLSRGSMGAYGEDDRLGADLLLKDFNSDPQSVEDLLGQVRSEAEMDERYERAIQDYLRQNPDVDLHSIPESMDLDALERLERQVLRGTPEGLTPDIDRIQDMTAAELEEAFGEFDDDNVIEELASRTESPFEDADFDDPWAEDVTVYDNDLDDPRSASVPESRGARMRGAAGRFARSLPWKEAAGAGILTLATPIPILADLAAEFAFNPEEMGSGTPYWREEGHRTSAEEQKFANDLMAARQDEEILPFTNGRYVPPAVPGARSTWMPDDLEGIEQLQGDAARFMAGRRRIFRPVRPR